MLTKMCLPIIIINRITQAFLSERLQAYHATFGPFVSTSSLVTGSKIIYSIGDEDPALQRELKAVENLGSKKCMDNLYLIVKGR